MASTHRFNCDDLYRMSSTNMDPFTETYGLAFYWAYIAKWPALCAVQENPSGRVSSYMIGKAEGRKREWHGHVSAVTVSPDFRRLGLAKTLMNDIERTSDKNYKAYFVDLFVRASNVTAISMYQRLGYDVYRRVLGYYGPSSRDANDGEDAFDMRKALPRDTGGMSAIPTKAPCQPGDVKFD